VRAIPAQGTNESCPLKELVHYAKPYALKRRTLLLRLPQEEIVKNIVMLIPMLALAPIWAGNPANLEEAQALSLKEGKPLMLDFYADW